MLHVFGDTGDMWAPLAATLVHDYTVVAPDLRGMGVSSHSEDGYDKKTQGDDIARVLDKLKIEKADFVSNMVGYAFAAQYPDRVTRWVVMDAPLPGIGAWHEIIRSPALWHFNFRGPDVERLVKGRERIYLDRFWNELSANPRSINLCRASAERSDHLTDEDSRNMPMAGGGFEQCYNAQAAVVAGSLLVDGTRSYEALPCGTRCRGDWAPVSVADHLDTGVIVPNRPSVWPLGPAVK